ncbi:MAG: sensor domain-containing protein [Acidobacteriia bacterium]|nr:sensor domain-containing protein [Terriglobia bacterium]
MTAEGAFTPDSDIDRIFGPVVHPQTYRHLLYTSLSFPLGLIYFLAMVVGLSVGFGLTIVVIGLVILAVTLVLARIFGHLEREMAKSLLGATFDDAPPRPRGWHALFRDRNTWRAVIYLILRLPVGIAGLVASLLMIVAVPLMAAPLLYVILPFTIDGARVANWDEALLVSLFGCVFFLVAAHAVNGVAAIARRLAMALL